MDKLTDKILPVKYPPITTYQHHANLLSMLSYYDHTLEWIFENYIQIYISKNYYRPDSFCDFFFPFYELDVRGWDITPWLDRQVINKYIINSKWDLIIDFIIDCIDNDYYISLMINTSKILHYTEFYHGNHPIFIYGYNLNNKMFYVADFFDDTGYSFKEVSFDSLVEAYLKLDLTNPATDYYHNYVLLFKIKQSTKYHRFSYQFSLHNIINSIHEYLLIDNYGYWYKYKQNEVAYGVEYYDVLNNIIDAIIKNRQYYDIRPFYILYDHKKMMLLRLDFLNNNKWLNNFQYIYNTYQELEASTKIVYNLLFKSIVSEDNEYLEKAKKRLHEIKSKEYKILLLLANSIKVDVE